MDGLKKKIQRLIGLWVIFCLVMLCVTIHGCNKAEKEDVTLSQETVVEATYSPTLIPTEEVTMMPTSTPTQEETATKTPAPTGTPVPTETPAPTGTPVPTETPAPTGTPVPTGMPATTVTPGTTGACPALSVDGTKLVDENGNQVQLRGVSTHGIAWFPQYVNEDFFRELKQEWGANVVRLAMYTAEHGGYCAGGDQEALKNLVKDGVEYATNQGLYVIIDWHILSDGNPNMHLEESKAFFEEMAECYADYTNVIYEICNEPNGGTTWSQVKEYAEQIITVIRAKDEDGIILVGTPNWCQYVDQAAADPLVGYENIMYTLHFYAATHKESLRNNMVAALESGLPLFVSEYGICDASGSGSIDAYQAEEWIKLMDAYQVSYVAWNLSNKAETSACFKPGCSKTSGFTTEDLNASGQWLYEMLRERAEGNVSSETIPLEPTKAPDKSTEESNVQATAPPVTTAAPTDAPNGIALPQAQVSAGLNYCAELKNSWQQDGKNCGQYSLTLTNGTDAPVQGWTVSIPFDCEIAVTDSWNGKFQVEGNVLTITPADYNSSISGGGSVGDIGFIIQFK